MTALFLLAIIGTWGSDVPSGNWVSLGGSFREAPAVEVMEADLNHVTVHLQLPGYATCSEMGYTRLDLPEYGWNLDTPAGEPELPFVPVVIGLPAGMEASVSHVEAVWTDAGTGTIYPVQQLRYDNEAEPFTFTELSGDLQGSYPAGILSLGEQGTWAGVNTVVLQFNPFSWNSDNGELQVASSITARIDFTGNQEFQPSLRPRVASMHQSRILNYESLSIPVDASPVSIDDVVYVVVVPPDNLETITPLIAMVNSIGHHVHIIEMEEGSTSFQIKSAINGVYQPGITRFALIAARHQQLESKDYSSFYGDFYYECLDSDNLPDIAVGRYPGNFTQLENQTAKTMSYITWSGTPGEPSLPAKVILAAHEQDYPGGYTANSNAVKDWTYTLADPVFETCYPPEGGTEEQVQNAIDAGVGIVNYRGHGSNTTWQWSPGWNAGSIYGLANTHFPPVFNVCCSNGNHSEIYNCLSESWMDGPGVGASGNIGASAPSLTTVNNRMQRVLFWEIFDNGNTCAGEMFAASQTDIIQTQGAGGTNNSRMYHWFGDPSMDIPNSDEPGVPFAMEIDAPEALNTGENNLVLTVTSGGAPVEAAVVTVTDGIGNHPDHPETFYVQDITDASGQVTLSFTAMEGKDLYYGVRLHNYASVTGTISITTEGIEGGEPQLTRLLSVTPSPASVSAAVSFQAPAGTPVKLKIVDLTGRTVAVIHDRPAPGGVHSVEVDTGDMLPGIYFAVLQSEGYTAAEKMTVVR